MRVLIVGAGGREHALAWALSSSPLLTKLYVAPGNPGTATLAENVAIGATNVAALVNFARAQHIELVVPGPEASLAAGLADAMSAAGIRCCGPGTHATRLEGSKAFAKTLCDTAGIPTARWERFEDATAARDFCERRGAPLVVKADGLAAGKGVVVAQTLAEAEAAIDHMLTDRALGEAGASVLIEECLTGQEVSLFALCDGTHAVLLGAAQDHKRVGDGDIGPNTGGMGAISPPPNFPLPVQHALMDVFVRPVLREMAANSTPFVGVLFAGLMLTANGPKLIEYNVRLGDPEAQALLPRLDGDLLPILVAACDGGLAKIDLRWRETACVAIVLASAGYPVGQSEPQPITGLAEAAAVPHVAVFHAGTDLRDGHVVSAGGRVLTVCGTGPDVASARASAYRGLAAIHLPGGFARTDIGADARP